MKKRKFDLLDVFIHTILILLTLAIILPIMHLISVSISSAKAYIQGVSIFPKDIDLIAYKSIIASGNVLKGFKNSVIYTVIGTAINIVVTAMAAFALSRKKLAFRKFYMIYVMIPMYFSGGLIPTYLLVLKLGMYNKIWAMIIPGAVSVWNLIVMRSFFSSIPVALDESAYLDGAGDITIFVRIILPIAKAGVAAIALFYMSAHWNSWFNALIYLRDSEKYPLQLLIRNIVMEEQMRDELAMMGSMVDGTTQTTSESIKYATIVIAIVPMLIVYPFIQKYFVKGVMIGSLKG